ncbi:MAG: hypothetical protein PQJ61_05005 [Spirochaetales bacterium]|uniref:DUF5640 domain-containing protein n=1 Tax=Candidatus Thalassospirochaeta sargassi TaxID=3119039 RepID=A0AAJ1IEW7_9SPIO|nr:hypothetical protein [Spirochaetales bacterium]
MKKHKLIMFAVVMVIILLLSSCGGLFMSEEESALVGLWRSGSWSDDYWSEESYCYYDFRDDGRVYITDWTENWPNYNAPLFPNVTDFNYSLNNDTLTLSQYFGILGFEFEIYSYSSDDISLTVFEGNEDYSLEPGDILYLTRIVDYSDETDAAARACLKEFGNE